MDKIIEEIQQMASSYAIEFTDKGNGHIQLSGHGAIVNYYPLSKNKTVYINGKQTIKHCSAYDAIKLCMKNGVVGLKPRKKDISENVADHDFKTRTVNRCGAKHFYSGDKPPWEYPTMIRCWPDILRSEALKLTDEAVKMETPAAYIDAICEQPVDN